MENYYFNKEILGKKFESRGRVYTFVFHGLLLLLIFIKACDSPIPPDENFAVEVRLYQPPIPEQLDLPPGGGGSEGPESIEPKEGGSKGSESDKPLEEVTKDAEKVETKIPEKVPTATPPKVILTSPDPEVIKVEVPKKDPPTKSKPADVVIPSNPGPVKIEPKPKPTGGTGSGGNASTGDNDAPGTGGSGSGTGAGTGSGTGNTGSGTGGGGGAGGGTGGGVGDGEGTDFNSIGPLRRKPIFRPDVKDLARQSKQSVVFNLCINRDGNVTYIKYNPRASATKDLNFIREATKKMQQYIFQADQKAPRKECGTFTFNASGMVERLN